MLYHVKRAPKRRKDKKNPAFRGGSVELCLKEDCLVCAQNPTSVRNMKDYGLISMETSNWYEVFREKKSKNKTMRPKT